jgi:hypothetical protein
MDASATCTDADTMYQVFELSFGGEHRWRTTGYTTVLPSVACCTHLTCSGCRSRPQQLLMTLKYPILHSCCAAGAWSLLDVCCMCASSKLLRSAWLQLLRQQPSPAWLLTAVADAASARTPALQAKATAVVKWLLEECLPEAALAQHPSVPVGLLTIPNIPKQLAEQLCRNGVQVPYQQIVAAARRRVPGKAPQSTVPCSAGFAVQCCCCSLL